MAFTAEDLIDATAAARAQFCKHLKGLSADQWDWKPYPECKSIRETLHHLITDDIAWRLSLQTGQMPDFPTVEAEAKALEDKFPGDLTAALVESNTILRDFLREHFADVSLDTEIQLWNMSMKLGNGLAHLCNEDNYHAGQVAFIRMATDPGWDYYGTIYGG